MAEPNHRVTIVVAIIGAVATLGAALIANWDKVFTRAPQAATRAEPVAETPVQAAPPADPVQTAPPDPVQLIPPADPNPRIAGVWRDSLYPNNGSKIVQDGSAFQFTRWGVLDNGVGFESAGSGTLDGRQVASRYIAKYQTGASSSGQCSGSVSMDSRRIELSCSDSLLGIFSSVSIRE